MPRPLALLAELTYRCPLKCPYCSNPLELARYRHELDTATWQRVLAEAAALGVIQVHFSGGEPLVRRDLAELVQHARQLDLYSNLSTGATLADPATLERLKEAGLDALQISLLDARPDGNDWLTGAASFDKKRVAVENAKHLGFPVTLNVVLHRHNLDRIEEIIDLACRWDVDRLELAHVQYTGWAFRNRAALLPTREQVERAAEAVVQARRRLSERPAILHVLPDYFQQYPKACLHGWGRVFLTVAPDGAVLPCQTAREIPGLVFPNVREASLESIWFDAPVFQRFRGTDWMPEPCRSCERREIDFGGCRCQAFLLTGDPAATDPVCHLSPLHPVVERALVEPPREAAALQFRVITHSS
ncbi:MAG: pyrroloquinoline quinone biosynthesis protein PqqE [Planctomycetes bacterium]|nr:pyrroloquinoline quinone biosynthesis protein PqqE [Planctomycetota bacterium]